MFIELTDHLRCLGAHDESYVVLLPDVVEARQVLAGRLGCPACGRVVAIEAGTVVAGEAPSVPVRDDVPAGEALLALMG
ncbi:MAG: hypothetical protein MUC69_09320, partial [Gemmatimonadales bacterium]|nr:hypothetical protein [Gemmatimonadales bacterium]